MQWKGRRQSSNIEDHRGGGGARKVGGVSIFGLILALIVWKVFGISPETTLGITEQITQSSQTAQAPAHVDLPAERIWGILRDPHHLERFGIHDDDMPAGAGK